MEFITLELRARCKKLVVSLTKVLKIAEFKKTMLLTVFLDDSLNLDSTGQIYLNIGRPA